MLRRSGYLVDPMEEWMASTDGPGSSACMSRVLTRAAGYGASAAADAPVTSPDRAAIAGPRPANPIESAAGTSNRISVLASRIPNAELSAIEVFGIGQIPRLADHSSADKDVIDAPPIDELVPLSLSTASAKLGTAFRSVGPSWVCLDLPPKNGATPTMDGLLQRCMNRDTLSRR